MPETAIFGSPSPRAPIHDARIGLWATNPQLLAQVEHSMRRLASSLGPDRLGDIVDEHLSTGGKRIRARLAIATVETLGGGTESALAWAAAVELLHNASLIHDDLQDGDRLRRGSPTTWVVHGPAQAINAGDLCLMLPFLAAGEVPGSPALRHELSQLIARYAAETVRGQSAEMDLLPNARLSWDDYLPVIEAKTAALFGLPVHGAALISDCGVGEARGLAEAFRLIGLLFQLQDDVLDLYGDKGRDMRGSDLCEGKVSALVVEHLERAPQDRNRLLSLLRTPREATCRSEVEWAVERFEESGALVGVLERIRALSEMVETSSALRAQPRVCVLARELAGLCLHPIRHVMAR